MERLPLNLDIRGRPCLVVGGGPVAARKAELLRRAGAVVHVVAPRLAPPLEAQRGAGELVHHQRRFRAGDVAGMRLVLAATDDRAVNAAVARAAAEARAPVNVADDEAASDFVLPAVVDRSPVTIAVSGGGAAPMLARILRQRLEGWLPPGYGRLARRLGAWRERVRARLADTDDRRRFWEAVSDGPFARELIDADAASADRALDDALERAAGAGPAAGDVCLVGAGPGDPGLLTLDAITALERADVVLHDRLVTDAILERARRTAERIYVGKARARHRYEQGELNALMIERARAGKRVVRLKGGDPYIFGRGGEEAAAVAGAGIRCRVIPGITAASGCAAYAGIPLTHRDLAHSCQLLTVQGKDGLSELEWSALVRAGQTLVIYMGLSALDHLCPGLVDHGMDPATPAAVVERGTTPGQRVLEATVAELPATARDHALRSPAIVIIGAVVRLRAAVRGEVGAAAPPAAASTAG